MEKKHIMKLRTEGGKWIIEEQHKNTIFDTAHDAWLFIYLMKEIRPKPPVFPRSLYPVRSLIPSVARGCKKVVYTGL